MKVFKVPAIITIALFLSFSDSLLAVEWFSSYEKAMESIKNQQWQAAVEQLNLAIAERPSSRASVKTSTQRVIDYLPYLYRGVAHYHLGNIEQAGRDLEKELASSAVRQAANDRAAIGMLQQYLNFVKQRRLAAPKFNEALALFNQKQYEAAKKGFAEVLKIDPNNAEAAKYLNLMEDEAAKLDVAKIDPAKAEAEKKTGIDKEFNSGVQAFDERNFDEAEKYFNRVLALDENFPGAADYLEKIRAGRVRVAAKAQIETVFNEGVSLFEAADWSSAESKFKTVLNLDSAYAGASEYLRRLSAGRAEAAKAFQDGERFFKNQKWDEAEEAFLTVIRLNKSDARASSYLDEIVMNRGAAATRQRAESLLNDGLALLNKGDWQNAKTKFLNVQRLDPASAPAKERLAMIARVEKKIRDGVTAFFEGEYDQAITQLADAGRLDAANTEAQAFLGCALAAKYFLSGEEDKTLYKNALEQFSVVKRLDAKYKLDRNAISPKIIALFEGN